MKAQSNPEVPRRTVHQRGRISRKRPNPSRLTYLRPILGVQVTPDLLDSVTIIESAAAMVQPKSRVLLQQGHSLVLDAISQGPGQSTAVRQRLRTVG